MISLQIPEDPYTFPIIGKFHYKFFLKGAREFAFAC